MSNSPVGVRLATPEDMRFVASTWFRSVLESNTVVNQLPYSIYKFGMEANIQRLLASQGVHTTVAFATDSPDEILGYCVKGVAAEWRPGHDGRVQTEVCHHVYVKSLYRRQGVARNLLGDVKTYTHPATPGAGKKFAVALGLSYNPRLG